MKTLNVKVKKGSVVIEAVIAVSLFMVILVTLFGMLMSIYLDETFQWATLQMRDEMSVYAMPFMGHDRIVQQELNLLSLSVIAKNNLSTQISRSELTDFIALSNKSNLVYDDFGYVEYAIEYHYNMPTVFENKQLVVPICAGFSTDGIDFSDGMVYITTYGEKFHKADCFHLRKSKFGILLSEAKAKGYEACKNCYGKEPLIN